MRLDREWYILKKWGFGAYVTVEETLVFINRENVKKRNDWVSMRKWCFDKYSPIEDYIRNALFFHVEYEVLNRDDYVCQNCSTNISTGGFELDGGVFYIVPLDSQGVKSVNNAITLCDQCYKRAEEGALPRYGEKPDRWNSIKQQVCKRDNNRCRNCRLPVYRDGDKRPVHPRHVVPRSNGGRDTITNIVALCETCHTAIHPHIE